MAQIRQYTNEANVNPGPAEGAAYSLERFGRINQESVQEGFGGLAKAADTIEKHEARLDQSNFVAKSAQKDVQLQGQYKDFVENHPDEPDAYQKFFDEVIRPAHDDLLEKTTTPLGRQYAEAHTAENLAKWNHTLIADQVREDSEKVLANTHSAINSLAAGAATNPELAAQNAETARFVVGSMLPPGMAAKEANAAVAHVMDAALDGALGTAERNPFITVDQVAALRQHITDDKSGFPSGASTEKFAQSVQRLDALQNFAAGTPERLAQAEKAKAENEAYKARQISTDAYNEQITNNLKPGMDFAKFSQSVLADPRMDATDKAAAMRTASSFINDLLQPEREARALASASRAEQAELRAEARAKQAASSTLFNAELKNVTAGAYTNPQQIYDMVGPGRLSFSDAGKLVQVMNRVSASKNAADGEAKLSKNFYDGIHERYKPYGPEGEIAYHDQYLSAAVLDDKEKADGVPASERYDPNSSHYVGRVFQPPKFDDAAATAPKAAPAARPFTVHDLDQFPRGEKGAPKGTAAIKAAVAAGHISRSTAASELITRGWAKPSK